MIEASFDGQAVKLFRIVFYRVFRVDQLEVLLHSTSGLIVNHSHFPSDAEAVWGFVEGRIPISDKIGGGAVTLVVLG